MSQVQQLVTWDSIINDVRPKFNQIAERHKLVRWQEECEFALQAVNKNKYLQECIPATVQDAIKNVAAVGLSLNPADGFAYLVPEYVKDVGKVCQLRISFKGLMKAATDSGAVQWVQAEIVKENDTFELNGMTEPPTHVRDPFAERGDTKGAYCVAKLHTGEYLTTVIPESELRQIEGCAKTQAVWQQWPDEMRKKAVIKRASKQWPKSEVGHTWSEAVQLINETEGSDEDYLIYTPEQKEAFFDAYDNKKALTLMGLQEGIAGGTKSEPGANSDICTAIEKAWLEQFRESKQVTAKKDEIRELREEGQRLFRAQIDEVIAEVEDNNALAAQELINEFDQYGLKLTLWKALDEETQDFIKGEA